MHHILIENCLFYEEVKRFKAITNVPTMLGTATDIKAQFIDRNGATPINVVCLSNTSKKSPICFLVGKTSQARHV